MDLKALKEEKYRAYGGMDPRKFLINPDQIDRTVIAPSVYASTGWVSRNLTIKECGAIMDIPAALWGAEKDWKKMGRMAPGKVVDLVGRVVDKGYCFGNNQVTSTDKEGECDEQGLEKEACSERISQHWAQSYLEKFGQSATKEDIAPVPVFLWDGYLHKILGEKGEYNAEIQGKALECVREKFGFRLNCRLLYIAVVGIICGGSMA